MADGGVVVIKFKADSTDIDKTLKSIKTAGKALNNDTKALNAQTKQYEAVTKRILANKKGMVTEDKLLNAKAKLLNAQTNSIKTSLRQSKDYLKAQNTYYQKINVNAKGIKTALAGSLKSLLAMASVGALVSLTKQMLELSSDLTEVQNVVDTAFPNMLAQIDAWAKNSIEKFGLSEKTIKEYASTLGLMTESMGLTEQQAFTLGTNLAQLTGDLASMYNKDSEEVFTNVKAGIIQGRANSMASLGIVLSDANIQAWLLEKGLNADYSAMSSNEKVIARYNYILEQTTKIQGDFTKTSGTWANQTRILRQNLEKLGAELGEMLVTVLLPLLQSLNKIVSALIQATVYLKEFLANIFGIKWQKAESSSSGIADGLDDITESAEEANKAVSKLTNGPFSELHKLAGDDASGSGSSLADQLGMGSYDVDLNKDTQNNKIADFIDKIKEKIDEIKAKLEPFMWFFKDLYNIYIVPIITRFQLLYRLLKDIISLVVDPFVDNWEKLKQVGEDLFESFRPFLDALSDLVSGTCQDLINLYDEHIHPMFEEIDEFLSEALSSGLDAINDKLPEIQKHLEDIGTWIRENITPHLDTIMEQLGGIFDKVGQLFDYITPYLPSLMFILSNLAAVFLDILVPAVQFAISTIVSLFEHLLMIIRGVIGLIIDCIRMDWQSGLEDLKLIFVGVFGWIEDFFDNFIIKIATQIENLVNTASNAVSTLTGGYIDFGQTNKITQLANNFTGGKLSGKTTTDNKHSGYVGKFANGGIFKPNMPVLATLGDNTSENEYALTESHLKQIALMMQGGNNSGNQPINIYLGNEQFTDFIVKSVENNNYRNGGM